MIHFFKDSYKVSLFFSLLFIAGWAVTAYHVYSLVSGFSALGGSVPYANSVALSMALTFLFGAVALFYSLKYRQAILVFQEKGFESQRQSENALGTEQMGSQSALETIKTALGQGQGLAPSLNAGLQALCKHLGIGQGALFVVEEGDGGSKAVLMAGYSLNVNEKSAVAYAAGEGLIGRVAVEGKPLYIDDIPEGYIKIVSGLGSASPRYLMILPIIQGTKVVGIVEMATFSALTNEQKQMAESAVQLMAQKF